MRLFSSATPKSSPELVRHSQVVGQAKNNQDYGSNNKNTSCSTTPPREHSPSSSSIVTTLGRKFSRRFERFGDSEAARRLRMASPSRKYQWALGDQDQEDDAKKQQHRSSSNKASSSAERKRVSRVDSFRNFLSLATSAVVPNNNHSNSTLANAPSGEEEEQKRGKGKEEKRQQRRSCYQSFKRVRTEKIFVVAFRIVDFRSGFEARRKWGWRGRFGFERVSERGRFEAIRMSVRKKSEYNQ